MGGGGLEVEGKEKEEEAELIERNEMDHVERVRHLVSQIWSKIRR